MSTEANEDAHVMANDGGMAGRVPVPPPYAPLPSMGDPPPTDGRAPGNHNWLGWVKPDFIATIRSGWKAISDWFRLAVIIPDWLPEDRRDIRYSYLFAVVTTIISILLTFTLKIAFPTFTFISLLEMLGIVVIALNFGPGPGIIASISASLLLNWFVIPPYWHLTLSTPSDFAGLVLFNTVGITISLLIGRTERVRNQLETEREQHARESFERAAELEAMLDAITDAIFVYDAHGNIRTFNPAARDTFALNQDDYFVQKSLLERATQVAVRTPDNQPYPQETWGLLSLLRGKVIYADQAPDMLVQRLDGQMVRFNFTGAPIFDTHGALIGAVAVLRDVTERRKLEQRTIETLNALLRMAEDLAPQRTRDLISSAQQLAALTRQVLACARVAVMAVEGVEEWVRPIAVVGLTPEDEARWWANRPEQVSLRDGGDLALLERFRAGEALVIDLLQVPFSEQLNPFDASTMLNVPILQDQRVIGSISLDYGGPPHIFTAEELSLAYGVAHLAAMVFERERLIRERASAIAQILALQETTERMDEFLGLASHELRTPLTSLKIQAQIVAQKVQEALTADAGAVALDRLRLTQPFIERENALLDRLNRLVGDLLDTARIRAGKLEFQLGPCVLGPMVREVVELQAIAWPGRTITLALPDHVVTIMADEDRINQVITNLVMNALKYAPPEAPITVTMAVADGEVCVAVHDQGPGLPLEEQAMVFDRFYRVPGIKHQDGAKIGLGLGLYICKTIVERHGGQIGVTSALGEGATFWFRLPRIQP